MKQLRLLAPAVVALLALVGTGTPAPLPKDRPDVWRDDFNGKLTLDWKVVRPDRDHVSLKKVPGSLVITTQRGSIHGKEKDDTLSEGIRAKNIHLIDIPEKEADWVATTCVSGLQAADMSYQQAGLIVYENDDNYLKWDYEFDWQRGAGQRFFLVAETDGVPAHDPPKASESGLKTAWLRLTRRGDRYQFAWSKDGKEWVVGGERAWGTGTPKRIGLIAKNGGNKDAAGIDVAFDFFELRAVRPAKK